MEFGDSKEGLFVEPNAYVQNFSSDNRVAKKVVFSEPYDVLPNYYLKNDFQRKKEDFNKPQTNQGNCNNFQSKPIFDIKNIFPMLSGFLGKGFDINSVSSILSNNKNNQSYSGFSIENIMNILSTDMGKNIINLFTKNIGKNSKKTKNNSKNTKSTDFCIDDYERV